MKKGFTLVELSIVLVIIGLLIGGILVGQSLIESAKLNAQIQQFDQYDIAIAQFKQKYKQIPGDCNKCGNGYGDGDGKLESDGNVFPPHLIGREPNLFFPDLSRMGLLKETFTISADSYSIFNIGKNKQFPNAKLGKGGIWVTSSANAELYYAFFSGGSDNGVSIWTNCGGGFMCTPTLTSAEAMSLDSKVDDASPITGEVVAIGAGDGLASPGDSSTTCVYTSKYNTSSAVGNLCRIAIKAAVN